MWNVRVPGIGENFYNFALWFLVYSVMGWVVETIYISIAIRNLLTEALFMDRYVRYMALVESLYIQL